MTGPDLAARQAQLIAALTAGAPLPAGFDARLVAAARTALLAKRAGEVARQWPALAAGYGTGWVPAFAGWAGTRAPAGALRDGWDLARDLAAAGTLPPSGREELAWREARWRYDGHRAPRPRRWPCLRRGGGVLHLQVAGRVYRLAGAPQR